MNRKPRGYWTKERCLELALSCNTRAEFRKNHYSAYQAAMWHGYLEECCAHMERLQKPNGYWTLDRCMDEAIKYSNKTDFINNSNVAYQVAHERGWLDQLCSHMEDLRKPLNHWTKDECAKVAQTCRTAGEFYTEHGAAYTIAARNGWLVDITSHMEKRNADCIYLVRDELPLNDRYLVKVGVTRSDLGSRRLKRISQHFQNPVVMAHHRTVLARNHERSVLRKFSITPDLTHIGKADGYSELRMLTAEEIGEAIRMVTL